MISGAKRGPGQVSVARHVQEHIDGAKRPEVRDSTLPGSVNRNAPELLHAQADVGREIDGAHPAAAERVENLVGSDSLADSRHGVGLYPARQRIASSEGTTSVFGFALYYWVNGSDNGTQGPDAWHQPAP